MAKFILCNVLYRGNKTASFHKPLPLSSTIKPKEEWSEIDSSFAFTAILRRLILENGGGGDDKPNLFSPCAMLQDVFVVAMRTNIS